MVICCDQNTSFFHQKASNRKPKNSIKYLIDDDGEIKEGNEALGVIANNYFTSLITCASPKGFEKSKGVGGN